MNHQNIQEAESGQQTTLKCLDTIQKIVYKEITYTNSIKILVKWTPSHWYLFTDLYEIILETYKNPSYYNIVYTEK